MTEKLSKTASGTRHLRWARVIQARLRAHLQHNSRLTADQKTALAAEQTKLDVLVIDLDARVVPYRDFLASAYLDTQAAQIVADYLCDEAQRDAGGRLMPRKKQIDDFLKAEGGYAAILSNKPLSRVLRAGREATEAMARRAGTLILTIPASILDTKDIGNALLAAADLLKGFIDEEKNTIDPKRAPLRLAVNTAVYHLREGLDQMDGRLRTHFPDFFIDSLYPELNQGGRAIAGDDEEDADTTDAPAGAVAATAGGGGGVGNG